MAHINLSLFPLCVYRIHTCMHACTHIDKPGEAVTRHITVFLIIHFHIYFYCNKLTEEKVTRVFIPRVVPCMELPVFWNTPAKIIWAYFMESYFNGRRNRGKQKWVFFPWLCPPLSEMRWVPLSSHHQPSTQLPNLPSLKQALQPPGETTVSTNWAWVKRSCRVIGNREEIARIRLWRALNIGLRS